MENQPGRAYGLSKNLFVNRKASGDSIVVGGVTEDNARWARVLSQRAAQMLWFNLVQLLFPEKAGAVSTLITTAPLRGSDLPTITTHASIDLAEDGSYEVTGWVGSQTWGIKLQTPEARRLLSELDLALGPNRLPGKSN
ncbi:MAG TPA: hypothetical protein VHO69_06120 [Phototrophicaceae bacterium]|nr:hypothetical protein [Phototrophicaceae bacterium]